MSGLDDELAAISATHARYLARLEADGFTRSEAFAMVRDHHALLSWAAIVSDVAPPPWLASPPESNESSPSTGASLRVLRPNTPEP